MASYKACLGRTELPVWPAPWRHGRIPLDALSALKMISFASRGIPFLATFNPVSPETFERPPLRAQITVRTVVPRGFPSMEGVGVEQIDGLRQRGFPTREYAVFGEEYFLYVLNRIAEEPIRLYQALIDVVGTQS
jgi:hypothetical protein